MIIIMYLKISRIPLLILMLIPSFSWAQQCRDYACVIAKVEKLIKQNQKDYKAILDNLDSAEGYPDSKAEEIRGLRRRVFVLIENEKNEAKRARDEAKKALAQVEIEKQKAIAEKRYAQVAEAKAKNAQSETVIALNQIKIERQTAIAEKTKAQAAEAKAKAVLDKIYFYDDKFRLAYDKDNKNYGFIDKDLNIKIDFKYDEALPFDNTGFAKVKKRNAYYLIDTTGTIEYKLATDINQLDSNITALDLRNKELTKIPPSVFQQIQLKVLLLGSNQLTSLPSEFAKLSNLTSLGLSSNRLTSLPSEFEKLTNLKTLDLANNKLTSLPSDFGKLTNLQSLDLSKNAIQKEEHEIIKKLLSNCEIIFD
jgi:Leucine-rich repeat (LRR) protein